MSQIDKIIYLPLIFWFIFLFLIFYFIILSIFTLIIIITVKTRALYLSILFKFSKYLIKNTEYLINDFTMQKINIKLNL